MGAGELCQLRSNQGIFSCIAQATGTKPSIHLSRTLVVLNCKPFFSTKSLVHLYKSLVLSYIESKTSGIYHAAPSALQALDDTQTRFLVAIGVSVVEGMVHYNLAPLQSRRDMALLGVLHKINLGIAIPPLGQFFPRDLDSARRRTSRSATSMHGCQLVDWTQGNCSELMRRSIFGLVPVYNYLPKFVVDQPSVRLFQRSLQHMLCAHAQRGTVGWDALLCR